MKTCRTCKTEKPLSAYGRNTHKSGKSYVKYQCNACVVARNKRQYTDGNGKSVAWKSRLKTQYGLTVEEYDGMLRAQGGVCAICEGPQNDPRRTRLCVDHDHTTGHVRGLLCNNCNRAIGLLKDSIQTVARAKSYLMAQVFRVCDDK